MKQANSELRYGTVSGSDLVTGRAKSLPLLVPYLRFATGSLSVALLLAYTTLHRPIMHESTPSAPAASYQLVVKKSERKLYLYNDRQKLLKSYKIALGFAPVGTKQKQGDGATPEGEYYLTHKNPKSNYYLSLGVSYPNSKDAASGLQRKLISPAQHDAILAAINSQTKPPQNTKLGGDIFIHGGGNSRDWTLGCVALENEDIKELFDLLPVKTPVKIEP